MSDASDKFDKYTLLRPLAKGGMGEVHLARSTNAAGIYGFVAIKRVLPELTLRESASARFKAEAATGMKLKHPNIVTIFEFGQNEAEQFFVVMELIRGQSLRSVINRLGEMNMHLPLPLVVHVMKGVASALNYARRCIDTSTGHPLNLVHKDISPGNVMIGYEGDVKVIDFGIARSSDADTNGKIEGKLSFMSPEHAAGRPVDHRSDLYSLGLVAFEMLTGTQLLGPKSRAAIRSSEQLASFCEHALSSLSNDIRPIVARLLEIDPEKRFQTGNDLILELGRLKFESNDVLPETGIGDLMSGLFADEITELNAELMKQSRVPERTDELRLDVAGEKTSVPELAGSVPALEVDPLFIPRSSELFVRAKSLPLSDSSRGPERPHAGISLEAPERGRSRLLPAAVATLSLVAVVSLGVWAAAPEVRRVLNDKLVGTDSIEVAAIVKAYDDASGADAPGEGAVGGGRPQGEAAGVAGSTRAIAPSAGDASLGGARGTAAVPSKINRFVKVVSQPAGALIVIDGAVTGKKTPEYLELPEGKSFRLGLKLAGYSDYESRFKPEERPQLTVELQAAPKIGQ